MTANGDCADTSQSSHAGSLRKVKVVTRSIKGEFSPALYPDVVAPSNDVRAEARFADLMHFVLGETGVPYDWEYGDQAGKS